MFLARLAGLLRASCPSPFQGQCCALFKIVPDNFVERSFCIKSTKQTKYKTDNSPFYIWRAWQDSNLLPSA